MEPIIPIAGPLIGRKEIEYATDAAATAWYGEAHKYNVRFERAFAEYHGVRFALSLPSCTSAIHLSLLALGIGPGDEVVVPDCTWIASAAPVTYVGATTVFADMDPETWCLTAASFAACITPRTKAVIPVDLYGGMADMDGIRAVAEERGIVVVEDAAEAVGSRYRGKPAGALGDTGVFSFHGTKTLTTGEGGMLITDREDVHRRVQVLRDHGRPPGDRFFRFGEVAWKYKMSSLQAAFGLAQLERIDELVARKREVFSWYEEEFAQTPEITLNHEPPEVVNTYWMVTAILAPELGLTKERLMELLGERNIDSRPFFYPLSSLPAYAGDPQAKAAGERNAVSYRISPYGINLPSAMNLTREQVARVCDVVHRHVK